MLRHGVNGAGSAPRGSGLPGVRAGQPAGPRSYWNGRSEEAHGIGLQRVRQNVFLTSKTTKRTRRETEEELAVSLWTLKADHLNILPDADRY